jgi:Zn-dependent peptidase ImmA (M78 family)
MSTYQIGDHFENKVFDLLSVELAERRLYFLPEFAHIQRKKGYYSKDRQKEIIVDISIEVFLPDSETWSMLMVIECKNYETSVPVNDVEEFHSKIQQIAGSNVKGVMFSSKGFQQGSLTFAKSKGIGLARVFDATSFKWILKRASTGFVSDDQLEGNNLSVYNGLIEESYTSNHMDFYATIEDYFTLSARHFFKSIYRGSVKENILNSVSDFQKQTEIQVPFVTLDNIEYLASELLSKVGYSDSTVPIETICDNLQSTNAITVVYENDLGKDALGFEILGSISFDPTVIRISRQSHFSLFSRNFTIAHEVGHHILNHRNFITQEFYSEDDLEDNSSNVINIEEIKRMEWQANHFASCLLLPHDNFVKRFQQLLDNEGLKDKGFGLLFVDNQTCNLNHFYRITNGLRETFRVSRKAVEIRLKDLKLMTDDRRNKRK